MRQRPLLRCGEKWGIRRDKRKGALMVTKVAVRGRGWGDTRYRETAWKTKQLRLQVTGMLLEVANPDLPGAWAQPPRSLRGLLPGSLGFSLEDHWVL